MATEPSRIKLMTLFSPVLYGYICITYQDCKNDWLNKNLLFCYSIFLQILKARKIVHHAISNKLFPLNFQYFIITTDDGLNIFLHQFSCQPIFPDLFAVCFFLLDSSYLSFKTFNLFIQLCFHLYELCPTDISKFILVKTLHFLVFKGFNFEFEFLGRVFLLNCFLSFITLRKCKENLKKVANITSNIVSRMSKNAYINLDSIEKICLAMDCKIQDVL